MYDSNIALWIFVTICVATVIVIVALFLSVVTYGSPIYGRTWRIWIRITSIAIIGVTGVYGYSYARLDIVTNTLITQYSDRPVQTQWNNNLGHATYRPNDELGRSTGVGVRFNACMPIRTQQDEPVSAVGLPHSDEWVSAPLISSQLWASTNASNIVPMTKEAQSSLYNVIEYEALSRFLHSTRQQDENGTPFPPDVCAHKSFEFTYTVVPTYVGDELIPREFVIDIFVSDGYTKHLVVSNGVPGKTIDYRTGAIN